MVRKLKPSANSRGFTLVEVMFVLAIAGLMLLIVLEALPALERSGRNNSRKQDVSTILEAVSRWELNNSGNIPQSSDNFLQYSTADLHFYTTSDISMHADSSGSPASVAASHNGETVDIYNYQKCDPTNPGASTAQAAGYSDVVAIYAIETNNSLLGRCQQL
jgi:prepilin-type N-terminal cleavage/methylation domain-containing protein